jgi:hypothetical protein
MVGTELGPVDGFKSTFCTPLQRCGRVDVNHVPGDGIGFHHGLDLGHLAIVLGFGYLVAGSIVGLVIRLALTVLVGASPGSDCKLVASPGGCSKGCPGEQCGGE